MRTVRNILSIIALCAGMMSCVKADRVYGGSETEIAMNPVLSAMSKAHSGPVTGTGYPTEETFGLFAYYSETEAGKEWTSVDHIYIDKREFTDKGGSFGGVQAAYWPHSGSLIFAGYSPFSKVTDVAFDANGKTMTFNDFASDDNTDLMYFLPELSNGNYVGCAYNGSAVPVQFHHALSWLSFEVKAKAGDEANISLKSITLKNVNKRGDFNVSTSTGIWSDQSEPSDIVLFNNDAGQKLPTPINPETLVIPGTAVNISIIYDIIQNPNDPSNSTKAGTITITPAEIGVTSWETGKKYIYSIILGAHKIEVGSLSSDWNKVSMTGSEL